MIYIDLSSRLYKIVGYWFQLAKPVSVCGLAFPTLITERIHDLFMYSSFMRAYASKCFTDEFYITVTLIAVTDYL